VLLIWAAAILVRSLYIMFIQSGDRPEGSNEVLSAVVSVMLLVPGAAALFLLVDFGRYIHDLRPPALSRYAERSREPEPIPVRLRLRRFWPRPFQTSSVRSGT
jgi:hypothetical protein